VPGQQRGEQHPGTAEIDALDGDAAQQQPGANHGEERDQLIFENDFQDMHVVERCEQRVPWGHAVTVVRQHAGPICREGANETCHEATDGFRPQGRLDEFRMSRFGWTTGGTPV
jgi:hypothetical protein